MKILTNPNFAKAPKIKGLDNIPYPSTDFKTVMDLILKCPEYQPTPLLRAPELAARTNIGQLYIKDERRRMGLGSFKALGAAYVIAKQAQTQDISKRTYCCATAGNHGLSVAASAQVFGAKSVIFLDKNVPKEFSNRLRDYGAHVIDFGADYEAATEAARKAAKDEDWFFLSDQSWADYTDIPYQVMEGYLAMMAEIIEEIDDVPTHIFLQAGVGGMAASCAALAREIWAGQPIITVVEPALAPALFTSIADGKPTRFGEGVSIMGRLDCKEPSLIALKGLARDANIFALIDEDEGRNGAREAAQYGYESTPSGAAGIAALFGSEKWRSDLDLFDDSRVLVILSEQA